MESTSEKLIKLAAEYNNLKYFTTDPIIFPRYFSEKLIKGESSLQDVEIAGILSAHLAWGRRELIVRDCNKMFDEMKWQPYSYIMAGDFKSDSVSLHRSIKWSDFAKICENLRLFYLNNESLECYSPSYVRINIYGCKDNPNAANKKIHMFRRWMVRNDGIVDLGLWKNISPADLIIPLDTHVHRSSINLGITKRNISDYKTAVEITEYLRKVFPSDPCLGDFSLFAFAATIGKKNGYF